MERNYFSLKTLRTVSTEVKYSKLSITKFLCIPITNGNLTLRLLSFFLNYAFTLTILVYQTLARLLWTLFSSGPTESSFIKNPDIWEKRISLISVSDPIPHLHFLYVINMECFWKSPVKSVYQESPILDVSPISHFLRTNTSTPFRSLAKYPQLSLLYSVLTPIQ